MLIFDLILFLSLCLFSSISISGWGKILNSDEQNNLLINFFLGFIPITLLITSLHFVIKIDTYQYIIIFFIGLGIFFYRFNITKNKISIFFIKIFFMLIPIYISQKFHEDFGYYHLPYVINFANEKIIFGLGNINDAFVHNSIWLNVLPIFNLKNNFNYLMTPTFLVYSIFVIFSINEILKNKNIKISSLFLVIIIFYFILKFTRISEFGNDLPALVFAILSIYFFFKFLENPDLKKKKKFFFLNLSFAIFAILIKFSVIPIIFLSLYLFIDKFKLLRVEIFKIKYLTIYLLIIIFFLQQFIYTGCLVFPSNFTCFNLSWFNEGFIELRSKLELTNKSYSAYKNLYSEENYLKNFNWLIPWFKRNFLEIAEHILTIILPVILFIFFNKKKQNALNINKKEIIIFTFFLIFGFFYWLKFSPVFRFGIIYFLCLFFLLFIFIFKKKGFSKKVFIYFISLFLIFNFTKNILRIKNEKNIFFGLKIIKNEFKINENARSNYIKINMPNDKLNAQKGHGWQGRLCWDINFICSRNPIIVYKEKKFNYLIVSPIKK